MSVIRVYIDLETTGVDPAKHEIVEVGAVAFDGPREVADFSSLVNPGEQALAAADPRAMDVNQIDFAAIRSAPATEVVAARLREFLRTYRGTLHAFPVEFEASFLRKAPWLLSEWGDCVMQGVQPMMFNDGALPLVNGKPKRPRLGEAAAFFGVTGCGPAHRSLSDARKTGRIHQEFMSRMALDDEMSEMIN